MVQCKNVWNKNEEDERQFDREAPVTPRQTTLRREEGRREGGGTNNDTQVLLFL